MQNGCKIWEHYCFLLLLIQLPTNNRPLPNVKSPVSPHHSHQVSYGPAYECTLKRHWEQHQRLQTPAAYRKGSLSRFRISADQTVCNLD